MSEIPRNPSCSDFSVSEDEDHSPNCQYFETNTKMDTGEMLSEPQKKEQKKKETHNIIERRRRYNINDRINELGTMLPKSCVCDVKLNKGIILAATVKYLKNLQTENERLRKVEMQKNQLEEGKKKLEAELQDVKRQLHNTKFLQSNAELSSSYTYPHGVNATRNIHMGNQRRTAPCLCGNEPPAYYQPICQCSECQTDQMASSPPSQPVCPSKAKLNGNGLNAGWWPNGTRPTFYLNSNANCVCEECGTPQQPQPDYSPTDENAQMPEVQSYANGYPLQYNGSMSTNSTNSFDSLM